jgi:hypothetical protein
VQVVDVALVEEYLDGVEPDALWVVSTWMVRRAARPRSHMINVTVDVSNGVSYEVWTKTKPSAP